MTQTNNAERPYKPIPWQLVGHQFSFDVFANATDAWSKQRGKDVRYWPLYLPASSLPGPLYYVMVWQDPLDGWCFFAKRHGAEYREQPELLRKGYPTRLAALRACYERYIVPVSAGEQPRPAWSV